ncbi:unnamed protein product [Enterobius vermicularis]|uniref:DUF4758 domain-containing protein n=1 Tax=Enterobius vermicularis TaxID=51028 RepID=A0A0N4V6B4_ENTVE|nr:unnamed protein product [Enterobius vermicularis]
MRILFLLLLFTFVKIFCYAQRTFANEKFDLSPDLPMESVDTMPQFVTAEPEMMLPNDLQMHRTLKPGLPAISPSNAQVIPLSPVSPSSAAAPAVVLTEVKARDLVDSVVVTGESMKPGAVKIQPIQKASPESSAVKNPHNISKKPTVVQQQPTAPNRNQVSEKKQKNLPIEKIPPTTSTASKQPTAVASNAKNLTLIPTAVLPESAENAKGILVVPVAPSSNQSKQPIELVELVEPHLPVKLASDLPKPKQRYNMVPTAPWYQESFNTTGRLL